MNSKQQGNIGLGAAISWFTANGYTVSIPLTDSQAYDLVVDAGELKRVQVRTTTVETKANTWSVGLRTMGGNRSGTGKVTRLSRDKVDLLFVMCANGWLFLIPLTEITATNCLSLGPKWARFRVHHPPNIES